VVILESVRRGWLLLLLVAIPLFAGLVAYAESLPDKFQATAVVSFSPRTNIQVGADVVRLVVPKFTSYVTSDATTKRVAAELGVDASKVQDDLSAAIPPETTNLEITISGQDRTFVSPVANALAQQAVDFSKRDPLLTGAIVSKASRPGSPAGPPRRLLEAAGALAALLVGVGVVLLTDRLRPVVRTSTDVAEATELRVLGTLPRTKAVRSSWMVALFSRRLGPAIRNLRTALDRAVLQGGEHDRGYILAVTSPGQGQGKTTVATLLAAASARVGQRVLLIDGDLLRPAVAQVFSIPPRPGLADALRAGDNEPLRAREISPGFSVLPTTRDPEAGDLITVKMDWLLQEAAAHFDVIILDSPPVFGNDAGQKLATLADGVIVIVDRGARTTFVEDAVGVLRSLDATLVGAVANGTRQSESAGYYA
jgi:Mrp family chromosome partitioning ATPase